MYIYVLLCVLNEDQSITFRASVDGLQTTENGANLLLPLGIQTLKSFQLSGSFASDLELLGAPSSDCCISSRSSHTVWPGDTPGGGVTYRSVVVWPKNCGTDLQEALDTLRRFFRIAQQKPFVDESVARLVVNQTDVKLIDTMYMVVQKYYATTEFSINHINSYFIFY